MQQAGAEGGGIGDGAGHPGADGGACVAEDGEEAKHGDAAGGEAGGGDADGAGPEQADGQPAHGAADHCDDRAAGEGREQVADRRERA